MIAETAKVVTSVNALYKGKLIRERGGGGRRERERERREGRRRVPSSLEVSIGSYHGFYRSSRYFLKKNLPRMRF